MVDPLVSKLIVSREKSIKVIENELVKLRELLKQPMQEQTRMGLHNVEVVKVQRLEKLKAELAGFRQLQPELPLESNGKAPGRR